MRTYAHVSGSRAAGGYRIIFHDDIPADVAAEFSNLKNAYFTRFHAARVLVLAMHEYCRKWRISP